MTLTDPPPDDTGALTAAWYRFQAELAAQVCLAMLAGEAVEQVVCEWHEDYVVVYRDDRSELVSVKHRELGQKPWTLGQLCDVGGLAHLFDRWMAAGGRARCRLQTNDGLRTGAGEPAELKKCCSEGDRAALVPWVAKLRAKLVRQSHGVVADDVIVDFLLDLRIEDGVPRRTDIRAHNLQRVVAPALERLRRPASEGPTIYDAVVGDVEAASRLDGRAEVLQHLADPTRFDAATEHRMLLAAKTIDRARLLRAIATDERRDLLLEMVGAGERESVLIKKLKAGAVGPTGINNARNLFHNWRGHVAAWQADLPGASAEFDDVQARVLMLAHSVENQVREPGEEYGAAMYESLLVSLQSSAIAVPGTSLSDSALLMGCAMHLTEECEIWWSDEFELEGVE